MNFLVGEKVLYCKVLNDKSTEELVEILHIDNESKSATIYIPSLKRERDTDLSRLYYKKIDDKLDFKLPNRDIWFIGNNQSTYISPVRAMIFNHIEGKIPLADCNCVPLFISIRELYTNIDLLFESFNILHKNQMILDKKINSVINRINEDVKIQNEINKKLNFELKELYKKIKDLDKK
jgi:hypothetical protein